MRFLRHYRSVLIFAVFLVVCSVMVIRQVNANQSKHVELREAFILLYTKGYKPQAEHLFQRLINDLEHLSHTQVMDDFQRTLTLVNPQKPDNENLIWKYHWTVSNEMERRAWTTLERALKLAEED